MSEDNHPKACDLPTVQGIVAEATNATVEDDDNEDDDMQGLGDVCGDRCALAAGNTFEALDALRASVANIKLNNQSDFLFLAFRKICLWTSKKKKSSAK